MSTVAADDLTPGDIVTVLLWKPKHLAYLDDDGCAALLTQRVDGGLMGDLLKIIAVDLPYLVVEYDARCLGLCRCTLDTRDVELKRPSPAYIDALRRQPST